MELLPKNHTGQNYNDISLLKSEFHIKSILGLNFTLSDSEQIVQVEFAIQQIEYSFVSNAS